MGAGANRGGGRRRRGGGDGSGRERGGGVEGELAVPPEAHVVAWYPYGPSPGDAGSAVLAGHVDWHGVPGIFFELRFLRPGNPVAIAMSDGSVRHFTVTAVQLIAKPEVPFADVFSRQGPPTVDARDVRRQFRPRQGVTTVRTYS